MSRKYQVVVSNLGTVCNTDSKDHANDQFEEFVRMSKLPHGRASGEAVTLFTIGEPTREHLGTSDLS